MKDNINNANTEKSRALDSHLFVGFMTRWTVITNDLSFI